MLFDFLALFSLLVVLLLLKRLVNVYPSLMACLWRGKECFNLEASVKLARDRDIITMAMLLPFCLVAFRFRLYGPGFFDGLGADTVMGLYFAMFFAYVALRFVAMTLFRPRSMPQKTYNTATKVSYTFFNLLSLALLLIGGVSDLLNLNEMLVRDAMLWVSAGLYLLSLLRKMQIFTSSCSVFAAFLYLCALELIPTGILIVPAVIF